MHLLDSLVEWSLKRIYLFALLTAVVAISGIGLSGWQQPAENAESSVTASSQTNEGESSRVRVDPSWFVATENRVQNFSSNSIDQEDLSKRVNTLVNQFLAEHQTIEDADLIATELGPLLDGQSDLL